MSSEAGPRTQPKRPHCPRCHRPAPACLCRWVTPTANMVEVLILQHPLEAGHAKGSAPLLQLSLQACSRMPGEAFDATALQARLNAPTTAQSLHGPHCPPFNVLLYPDAPTGVLPHHAEAAEPCQWPADLSRLRLIVLDGTWRKSRKMLHLNPVLQTLPRLALQTKSPSRYLIRRAQRPGQLATLEACCMALSQLEGMPGRYAPLLHAFDGLIAAQRHPSVSTKAAQA